jgi:glutamate/tyrosine decarboxylase-like PLP-dependent enzyme
MSQPTLTVKDASGTTQTVFTHNPNGPAAAVNSQPVVLATDATLPLPTGAGETDRSGSITAGGTAQTIMAANAARKYFELQNLDASNALYFRKDGSPAVVGASGSFALTAGGFYSGQSTGAVSVIGATTGQKFSAVEA